MPRQIVRVKRDEFFRVFNRGIILFFLKIRDGEVLQRGNIATVGLQHEQKLLDGLLKFLDF